MTREGRAEVERFLHSYLSMSLLVGFILSDSSHLQKILPNSLSPLQQSLQPALGPGWCFLLLAAIWEPHGTSGRLLHLHPYPATPWQSSANHSPARQPCGKGAVPPASGDTAISTTLLH